MSAANVILCERTGAWALALRGAWSGEQPLVVQTRSLEACWDALAENPAGFLLLEAVESRLSESLQAIYHAASRFPRSESVVLAAPGLEPWEAEFRQAGALDVVYARRQVARVARLAERHLARFPAAPMSLVEEILAGLPWK